jgi:hypothetical protein
MVGGFVGAVAQLGERGLCKPEVVGSIPISSTSPRAVEGRGGGRESGKWFPAAACCRDGFCKRPSRAAGPAQAGAEVLGGL